jgi:C-terminal processing protease CtpA/Prc
MVGVPFAKSLDPVTKTNWEGTGVEPDVKVAAADALTTAEKLALEKIQAKKDGK